MKFVFSCYKAADAVLNIFYLLGLPVFQMLIRQFLLLGLNIAYFLEWLLHIKKKVVPLQLS